jgi:hypothetical protein
MKIRLVLNEAFQKGYSVRQITKDISRDTLKSFKDYINSEDFKSFLEDSSLYEIKKYKFVFSNKFKPFSDFWNINPELSKKTEEKFSNTDLSVKAQFVIKKHNKNVFFTSGLVMWGLDDPTTLFCTIECEIFIDRSMNQQEIINDFKSDYEKIKKQIYETVTHEIQHLVQHNLKQIDKNKLEKYKTSLSTSNPKRSKYKLKKYKGKLKKYKEGVPINKIMPITYDKNQISDVEKRIIKDYVLSDKYHGKLDIEEIEAYAKGIYSLYKEESKEYREKKYFSSEINIPYFVSNYIQKHTPRRGFEEIYFYVFLCRYIYHTYPEANISIKDFDRNFEILKNKYGYTGKKISL